MLQYSDVVTREYLRSVAARFSGWRAAGGGLYTKTPDLHWGQVFLRPEALGPARFQLTLASGASSPDLLRLMAGRDPGKRPPEWVATVQAITSVGVDLEVVEGRDPQPGIRFELWPRRRYLFRVAPEDVLPLLDSYFDVVIPLTSQLLDDEEMLAWNWGSGKWARADADRSLLNLKMAVILARRLGHDDIVREGLELLSVNESAIRGFSVMSPKDPLALGFEKFKAWVLALGTDHPVEVGRRPGPGTKWFIEAESGKRILMTDDGIDFFLGGDDAPFARRDGQNLTGPDGTPYATVSKDGRTLFDPSSGLPVAVEEKLYRRTMRDGAAWLKRMQQ